MNNIPLKLRAQLAFDPFMRRCIWQGCTGKPEWEHCWTYAGRQIQERWAIVPCCWFHHRGPGLVKNYNRYVSLLRAQPDELLKYPRVNWRQLFDGLAKEFGPYWNDLTHI